MPMKGKILTTIATGYGRAVQDSLPVGSFVDIYILEHDKHDTSSKWALISVNVANTNCFNSDRDVESGVLERTYQDPELPKNYDKGGYIWVEINKLKIVEATNNAEAKSLLQKYEWQL